MAENSKAFMKTFDLIAAIFLSIGGLNWGFIAFFNVDLIAWAFGSMSVWTRVIYALAGFGALYDIIFYKIIQRRWGCEGFFHRIEGSAS